MKIAAAVAQIVGAAMFAYAFVYVGIRGKQPKSERVWGSARRLNRWVFASYFGAMGITLSLAAYLIILNIGSSSPVAEVTLITISAALFVGWLVMRHRADNAG